MARPAYATTALTRAREEAQSAAAAARDAEQRLATLEAEEEAERAAERSLAATRRARHGPTILRPMEAVVR